MASNSEWKEDNQLENDLRKYVSQNFKRSEILDFVQRDFPEYTWSTATLERRLRHFGIYYINYDTPVAAVSYAAQKELAGKIVRLQSNESEAENRAQCTGTTPSCIQRDG